MSLGKIQIRALLFSILLILAAAYLGAAENSSKAVKIKIDTILASNQSGELDSRLKPLEKQLKVLKYKSYRLLKEESQNVPSQGNGNFEIPGGRSLIVSPQDYSNQQIALKVRLQEAEKPLLDTT
ncbi:MAG TPA: hypothetical protein VMO00_09070, partial [Methylomirabilota bacterium]|nr:hypothetical protein [Methylomirabilota bacterium]